MKKKILLTLLVVAMLVCVFAISVSAADITVDGINYKTSGTTATFNADNPTDGTVTELVIPETITHEGVTYNVTGASRGSSWPSDNAIINSVQKVTLPATVKSVPSHIFRNYKGLTEVTFLGEISSFNNAEFYQCTALTKVTFTYPDKITRFGGYTFSGCTALTTVAIPSTVTYVGTETFYNCKLITNVIDLPNLTGIDGSAFRGCESLTTIKIGGTFTVVPASCFWDCKSATTIDLTGAPNVTAIYGNAIRACAKLKSFHIADGVTSIGEYAFYQCYALESLNFPTTLTKISDSSFRNCSAITSFDFSNTGITSIPSNSLRDCTSLSELKLPNTVTSIGGNAIQETKLTSVIFPRSITSISNDAFANNRKIYFMIFPEIAEDNTSINAGGIHDYYPKVVIYPGNTYEHLTSSGKLFAGYTVKPFSEYDPNTTYTTKTFFYGATTCSSCNGLLADGTSFEYTDYLSSMKETQGCTNCDAKTTVSSYEPMFKFLGYSVPEKEGVYSLCVGYSMNRDSISAYEEKTEKTVSYGVIAVATDRITEGKTPLEMVGTVPVVQAPLSNLGSVSLRITGFTTDIQKAIKLTMALYVTETANEESTTVYLQSTQCANPSGYSISQYEIDTVA